jgi:hypothetical protein
MPVVIIAVLSIMWGFVGVRDKRFGGVVHAMQLEGVCLSHGDNVGGIGGVRSVEEGERDVG